MSSKVPQKSQQKSTKNTNSDEEKISKAAVYFDLCQVIDRTVLKHPLFPSFPRRFFLVEGERSTTFVIEQKDDSGRVEFVPDGVVASALINYLATAAVPAAYDLVYNQAELCVKHWKAITKSIAMPPLFRWLDDKGLCFVRLPFNLKKGATLDDCPRFKEILSRTTNSEAFTAWIGSLFDGYSDRQQYLWLYGDGRNGKGSLANFLEKIFGRGYQPLTVPGRDERFWTSSLLECRVAVFSDCASPSFPAGGFFKGITGGNAISIEIKGGARFKAKIPTKFLFLSNDQLEIDTQKADLRRAVYCEIGAITAKPDPKYDERLWSEAEAIVGFCVAKYQEVCPEGGPIPVEEESLHLMASRSEEHFEEVFERRFELVRSGSPEVCCKATEFARIMNSEFPRDQVQQRKFRLWLKRTYDAESSRTKHLRYYSNIKARHYVATMTGIYDSR